MRVPTCGVVLAFAILITARSSVAHADTGAIDVYSDTGGVNCSLNENVYPPVVFLYYFLSGTSESTGVQFAVPVPACWVGASFAGDSSPHVTTGNTRTTWTIGFGECKSGRVYVGNTAFIVSGQATPCCQVAAVAGIYDFVWTDCQFDELPLTTGGKVTINSNATCPCQLPLHTESTSWGRVKALYHD